MASITKRGSGFEARVSVKVNGKYKRINKSGFKTRAAAKAWAVEQEAMKANNTLVIESHQRFPDYFSEWVRLYRQDASDAQKRWYKFGLNVFTKYLSDVRLDNISRPVLQDFLNKISKQYAFSTVKRIKTFLTQSLKTAYYDELINKDPTPGLKFTGLGGKDKELKFLEEPQMKALIKFINNIPPHERKTSDMLILAALQTGARYEELAALTWDDIIGNSFSINKAWDQISHVVKEVKTKSSNRIVDVPESLIIDLKSWSPTHPDNEFIFKSDVIDNPITGAAANKRLKHILREIKSPKIITFHGLRHTHASWLLSHNVDIKYVSERLGHASITMTLEVYTHLLQKTRDSEATKSVNLLSNI